MINTQTDVFDVPVAVGTILTVRETNAYDRTFVFRNLTAAQTLNIEVQNSDDGGTTWDTAVAAFNLLPGIMIVKTVVGATYANILRVRASGGGADRDLYLALQRPYLDAAKVWSSPVL